MTRFSPASRAAVKPARYYRGDVYVNEFGGLAVGGLAVAPLAIASADDRCACLRRWKISCVQLLGYESACGKMLRNVLRKLCSKTVAEDAN